MREWVDKLEEIDQDCVYQYEYLLGRELKNYEEYHEIDGKVMEMILEFETREDFFEYYPEIMKQYANPAALEYLPEATDGKAADEQNETLHLWGRLGISLDVTPQEFAILNSDDERSAQELLVTLIQSNRCQMDGNTYFPYKDEALRPDNPEEDLEFELDPRPLRPEQEPSRAYTIAMANNVDYEVEVLGPFFSREETQEALRRLYMDTWENVGEDRIVEADCDFDTLTFKIEAYGTELYYANVKELDLDRSEIGKTSSKENSTELSADRPKLLADRIASAEEKSNKQTFTGSKEKEEKDPR